MADYARRYALALFRSLPGARERAEAALILSGSADYLSASPEARAYISDPLVAWSDRNRAFSVIVEAISGSGAPAPSSPAARVRALLSVLSRRGRMGNLGGIASAFRGLVDAAAGTLRAEVECPKPLDGKEREALEGALSLRFGTKNIVLEEVVIPGLLGGIRIRVGDQALDGSLKGRLDRLRRHTLQEAR